jgi:hypothetical protein
MARAVGQKAIPLANQFFFHHVNAFEPVVGTRVTRYPISIWRMTVSILSSPISLNHIRSPIWISHIDIGSYLVTLGEDTSIPFYSSSTTWCTGAHHVILHIVNRCSPHPVPPHVVS